MKKLYGVLLICLLTFYLTTPADAGVLGDINGDGHVDLTEALYGLRIASGLHPNIPDSCVITGYGDWLTGQDYNLCDVVFLDGSFYICSQAHTSTSQNTPPNDTYWAILALKGDPGPTGPTGSSGSTGPQGPPGVCHPVPLDTFSTNADIYLLPCRITISDSPIGQGGQFFGSVLMNESMGALPDGYPTRGLSFVITLGWPMEDSIDIKELQSNLNEFDEVIIETYVSGLLADPYAALVHGRWILSHVFPNNIMYRCAINPDTQSTYVTETITLTAFDTIKETPVSDQIITLSNKNEPATEIAFATIDVAEADSSPWRCDPPEPGQEIIRRKISFFDLQYNVPLDEHGSPTSKQEITLVVNKRLYSYRDEPDFTYSCVDRSYLHWSGSGDGGNVGNIVLKGWEDSDATLSVFEISFPIPLPPVSYNVYQVETGRYETFTAYGWRTVPYQPPES